MDSGSKVTGSKGKLVRHLDRERGVAGLVPLTLILDVKHQQFWQPSDSQYVLHCERYCYFPRSSTVCPGFPSLMHNYMHVFGFQLCV